MPRRHYLILYSARGYWYCCIYISIHTHRVYHWRGSCTKSNLAWVRGRLDATGRRMQRVAQPQWLPSATELDGWVRHVVAEIVDVWSFTMWHKVWPHSQQYLHIILIQYTVQGSSSYLYEHHLKQPVVSYQMGLTALPRASATLRDRCVYIYSQASTKFNM